MLVLREIEAEHVVSAKLWAISFDRLRDNGNAMHSLVSCDIHLGSLHSALKQIRKILIVAIFEDLKNVAVVVGMRLKLNANATTLCQNVLGLI